MFRLPLSSHIYFCFSRHQSWHFGLLALRNKCVATHVSERKWVQSTERDIVNGSFCNLCVLALWLALLIFATQVYTVLISPVPELYFPPALHRGLTRAGERRVQNNLHPHAQNEPIKNYQVPTTLLVSMCRAMPFSARALKENIFVDVDIVIKNTKT